MLLLKIATTVTIRAGIVRPTAGMTCTALAVGIAMIHRERMVERCVVKIASYPDGNRDNYLNNGWLAANGTANNLHPQSQND